MSEQSPDSTDGAGSHTHPGYMHRKDDYLRRMKRV